MNVFHPAVFADGQTFASGLQLFFTNLVFLARFQSFGGVFMGGGHGTVALDVFPGFLVVVLRMGQRERDAQGHRCKRSCNRRQGEEFFDGVEVCHKKVTLIGEVQTH